MIAARPSLAIVIVALQRTIATLGRLSICKRSSLNIFNKAANAFTNPENKAVLAVLRPL
jgi:hypothetical protein